MKALKKTVLGAAMALAMTGGAQAGVMALSDMFVYALGFESGKLGEDYTLNISGESRTGTAAANYNGIDATGVGAASITGFGTDTVDVGNRCAGDCVTAATLYIPGLENALNSLSPPAAANFALGDMFISGNALGSGSLAGLTRADAVATGPTNSGGSNATILNSGVIEGSFTASNTFTTRILLGVDALLQAWIDPANFVNEQALASVGYGWVMNITGNDGTSYHFAPSEVNKTFNSTNSANNAARKFEYTGSLFSDSFTFTEGVIYDFSINQSSNANIRDIPEPGSLALAGLGLLGLGALRRRKAK